MDRDTEAFNVVSAAFGMPKATDEEKAARSAAIQKGLEGCTKTPFEMMELAVETLELTASILGKSNDSAASDLGVSALSLRSAIQGAWLNVLINIGSLKNKELAEDYRAKGEALLAVPGQSRYSASSAVGWEVAGGRRESIPRCCIASAAMGEYAPCMATRRERSVLL